MFIVIEGLDGSGKTTTAGLLAKRLGAVMFRSPPSSLETVHLNASASYSLHARMFYYLLGNFCASDQIEATIKCGRSVVSDRYWYSTVAGFSEVMSGYGSEFRKACTKLMAEQLVPPDRAFFLDASVEERKRRLLQRRSTSELDWQTLDERHSSRVAAEYIALGLTRISVDRLAPEEVVSAILGRMVSNGGMTTLSTLHE